MAETDSLEEVIGRLNLDRNLVAALKDLGLQKLEDLEFLEDCDLTRVGLTLVNVKKLRRAGLPKNRNFSPQDLPAAQARIHELQVALEESTRACRDFILREEDYQSTIENLTEQVALYKRRSEDLNNRLDRLKAGSMVFKDGDRVQKAESELMDTIVQLAEVKQELRNKDIEMRSAKASIRSLESSLQAALSNEAQNKTAVNELVNAFKDTPPYGPAVDALATALGNEDASRDPMALLPLLRGLLKEVIQREDHRSMTRGVKVRSAFNRFGKGRGKGEAAGPRGGEGNRVGEANEANVRPGLRRWRRILRAAFNEDAAAAMLDDLLERYSSEDFAEACRNLDQNWPENCRYAQQRMAIQKLCLRMGLASVLTQYGFSDDVKGVQDINSAIQALTKDSEEVFRKDAEVQRSVLCHFSHLNPSRQTEGGSSALNRTRMESVLNAYGFAKDGESEEEEVEQIPEKSKGNLADLDGLPAADSKPPKAQLFPKTRTPFSQARHQQKVKELREEFPE